MYLWISFRSKDTTQSQYVVSSFYHVSYKNKNFFWASPMVHSLVYKFITVIRVTGSALRKMAKNCGPLIFSRRVFRPRLRCDSYILPTFVTLNRAMNNNNNIDNETRVSVDDVSAKNKKNRVNNVVNSSKQSTRRQSSSAVAGVFRSSEHARTC